MAGFLAAHWVPRDPAKRVLELSVRMKQYAPNNSPHGQSTPSGADQLALNFGQPQPASVPLSLPPTTAVAREAKPPKSLSESKGAPKAPSVAATAARLTAHARHKAQNEKKGREPLHVDIKRKYKQKIEELAAHTGFPQCRIVEEIIRHGFTAATRHFNRQMEL